MGDSTGVTTTAVPGFELRREPMPTNGRDRGRWVVLIEAMRDAANDGECVVFEGPRTILNNARANLNTKKLPGEKIHVTYDAAAGVCRAWITHSWVTS